MTKKYQQIALNIINTLLLMDWGVKLEINITEKKLGSKF
jgi:hypothetical protein